MIIIVGIQVSFYNYYIALLGIHECGRYADFHQ